MHRACETHETHTQRTHKKCKSNSDTHERECGVEFEEVGKLNTYVNFGFVSIANWSLTTGKSWMAVMFCFSFWIIFLFIFFSDWNIESPIPEFNRQSESPNHIENINIKQGNIDANHRIYCFAILIENFLSHILFYESIEIC